MNVNKIMLFISIILFFLTSSCDKKEGSTNKKIELNGFFYRHIPYNLSLPKEVVKSKGFQNKSKHLKTNEIESYYDKVNTTIRFNITQGFNPYLHISDSISENSLRINIKSKHPPLDIIFQTENGRYYSGNTINKREILSDGGFTCSVINFDIDFTLSVKHFDIVFFQNNQIVSYPSNGPKLSNEQKKVLGNLTQNTAIVVKNMVVQSLEEEVNADPIVFFLVADK